MTKLLAEISGKGKALCLIVLCLLIVALSCYGCTEKKEIASKETPSCELLEKLPGDIAKPVQINYGNKIKLVGVTSKKLSADKWTVSYYWQPLDELGQFNQVFVHFVDTNNNMLFQNDHPFCQKKSFGEVKGKYVKETYLIAVPKKAAGKESSLKVGIFAPEAKGWPRVKIESAEGGTKEDDSTSALVDKLNL